MTEYLLSIDPGKSSGVALLSYDENTAPTLEESWQPENGVVGLRGWLREHTYEYIEGPEVFLRDPHFDPDYGHDFGDWGTHWTEDPRLTIISEKYVPLPGRGFHHTLDSVEPLRGEGFLVGMGLMPDYPDQRWRRADRMYLHGGKSLAEKRKRSHRYLKESGYYVTGADVGRKDANDVRSAILHGLSYLTQVLNHRPTFDSISSWAERNP